MIGLYKSMARGLVNSTLDMTWCRKILLDRLMDNEAEALLVIDVTED